MFDLDIIEKDWQENSFCLSDKEIMDIYKQEGITRSDFLEEYKKFKSSLPCVSAEERLLATFLNNEELNEKIAEIDAENQKLIEVKQKRRYLSAENQKKIIEGCLDVVFSSTRYWFSFFNGNISLEKIYYTCLEGLFNAVKYCVHYRTKAYFRSYVLKTIKNNIIRNIAKWEHISYHNAYCLIENHPEYLAEEELNELKFAYDLEESFKPSVIYEQIKNDRYDVDYISKVSSQEFMQEYMQVLDELPEEERIIMNFLFTLDGEKGFTNKEISEYLGINAKKVGNMKRKVLRKLRCDSRFDKYRII